MLHQLSEQQSEISIRFLVQHSGLMSSNNLVLCCPFESPGVGVSILGWDVGHIPASGKKCVSVGNLVELLRDSVLNTKTSAS